MVRTLWGGQLGWPRFSFIKEPKSQCFKKKFNKLLPKPYIVSDTDHITDDGKAVEEGINILNRWNSASHALQITSQPNQSINLWSKLPDEIVETILWNAIGSSSNAIQENHSVMQTCSRFQIVQQKGKRLLPAFHILVTETWLCYVIFVWYICGMS